MAFFLLLDGGVAEFIRRVIRIDSGLLKSSVMLFLSRDNRAG